MTYLRPGMTTTLQAEIGPGALSGVNVQTQAGFILPVVDSSAAVPITNTPMIIHITYNGQRFTPVIFSCPTKFFVHQASIRIVHQALNLNTGSCQEPDQPMRWSRALPLRALVL